jgi:hypothetical protein
MSLDVTLTIEDIVEQIKNYEKQLVTTENAIQQIKGAIASCQHQMNFLVTKQNEHALNNAKVEQQQEEPVLPESNQGEQNETA